MSPEKVCPKVLYALDLHGPLDLRALLLLQDKLDPSILGRPHQVPVTSTVTSVRSIQSCFGTAKRRLPARPQRAARRWSSSRHRGGEAGGEDGSTRRKEIWLVLPERDLTGHFVSADGEVALQPASRISEAERIAGYRTVDTRRTIIPAAETHYWSTDPLTADPFCSRSSRSSREPCVPTPLRLPDHVPVTFSVTSVRSIQSCFAQPEPTTSAAAMSRQTIDFIRSYQGEGADHSTSAERERGNAGRAAIGSGR